jgi:hypothetical protein
LSCPLEQKEQLSLERRRPWILVEALEKRILIGLFEDELAAQGLSQTAGETGLAHPDRALDDNESVRYCARH